ncbi:hypothetical protein KJR58_24230, partial [Escherichia coli]|uniref:hypothetical protein n=1 Tax=Escherichia coli TaxID=562 RepID=UPI00200397BA
MMFDLLFYFFIHMCIRDRLEIAHIRNGDNFVIYADPLIQTRKDAMTRLAGSCLKALDRLEGVFLEPPRSEDSKKNQKKLISYLLRNISEDRPVVLSCLLNKSPTPQNKGKPRKPFFFKKKK